MRATSSRFAPRALPRRLAITIHVGPDELHRDPGCIPPCHVTVALSPSRSTGMARKPASKAGFVLVVRRVIRAAIGWRRLRRARDNLGHARNDSAAPRPVSTG
jgi:hypothetical protein